MSNTHSNPVRIAIDIANEFHLAGLLIPANAKAAYRAAAETVGAEIKFVGDGTPESHAWQTDDFNARQDAYDALHATLNVDRIPTDPVVAQVRTELDDDGWLDDARLAAICDQHGVSRDETDVLLDWAQA